MKLRYKGKIKNLNHIVVSDPYYKKGTWCRYEIDDLKEKDWLVDLAIYPVEDKIGKYYVKGLEFMLLLKQNEEDCSIEKEGSISYLSDINIKDYKIGMDTACIALGINNKAKEIIESRGEWQPSCAIRTGGDGIFGDVSEGKKNGKLSFLLITGYFDEEFINQNQLFDYLKEKFEIADLIKEDVTLHDDNRVLNKGDKVEVSTCFILNDIKGIKEIRNSSYKNKVEGTHLEIINPDGSKEETILKANDKLVNNPIEVEVIDNFYDYETGYHYKGKIINKDLIQELNKLGNSESIFNVNFSEFDVVKILEKDIEKGDLEL